MNQNSTFYTLTNGITGMIGSMVAVISPFQEQIEWGVRITGGTIGLAVGCITLYNLAKIRKP